MNIIHASDDYNSRFIRSEHAVIVNRPTKRTRTGGIHKGSRAAIIRLARIQNPEYTNAPATEIFYGTSDSQDTVVIFDPSEPLHYSL